MFDLRYFGFVGDDVFLEILVNCKDFRVFYFVDILFLIGNFDEDGFGIEDVGFLMKGLVGFFFELCLIEELVLDVCKNVRGSWVVLEVLVLKCFNLRFFKLGYFYGICKVIEFYLDGIFFC